MRRNLILAASVVAITVATVLMATASPSGGPAANPVSAETNPATSTTEAGPTRAEVARWNAAADEHRWNVAALAHTINVQTWVATTEARLAAEQAERERQAAIEAERERQQAPAPSAGGGGGSGRCGGSLPPCSVMMCESGGNIHAQNPSSSASGKWQIIDSTWGGFMGYPTAASAPEWVQDLRAEQIYAGGAGRSQWSC